MVIIGIDPHKSSHTASGINEQGSVLAGIRVSAQRSATRQLLAWARQWPQRRWAIEGSAGLGRLLAQKLVAAGEEVVGAC